uniref:FGF n=1 Tax=Nothobranchius furzeri TaxID=105023 RepID=A0A8C6M6F6_NOTFU
MLLFPNTPFCLSFSLFLILPLPFSLSFYVPESNPLLSFNSQVREVHLFTGIWFLKPENLNVFLFPGVLQLKSVKPGHAVIKGQSSSLFLCMDSGGHLRGQVRHKEMSEADCSFRELLLADGYTRFLNSHHGIPISLASRNSQDQHSVPFTRFLPLRNMLPVEGISEDPVNHQRGINVESDDLFGMGLNTVVSPQLLMEK